MQAVVKLSPGPGHVGLRRVPIPVPGPGQIRVAVLAAGICGTDLHIVDDEFPTSPPVVMGHEVTGHVDSVGEGVAEHLVGQRVALETYAQTCGVCVHCRDGRVNLCGDRRSIGSRVDGGYADYLVVPVRNLHQIDESVGTLAGALYEPLACVAQAICGPPIAAPGDRALVIGPGTVGLLTAQVLHAQGARVSVVGAPGDEARLGVAAGLNFDAALGDSIEAPADGFDVVAECSGSEGGIALALASVRKGGHWAQIGLAGRKVLLDLDVAVLKELQISLANASTPASWQRAERLVSTGAVLLDPLVSRTYPLASWEDAFAYARGRAGVKVLLSPRPDIAPLPRAGEGGRGAS